MMYKYGTKMRAQVSYNEWAHNQFALNYMADVTDHVGVTSAHRGQTYYAIYCWYGAPETTWPQLSGFAYGVDEFDAIHNHAVDIHENLKAQARMMYSGKRR